MTARTPSAHLPACPSAWGSHQTSGIRYSTFQDIVAYYWLLKTFLVVQVCQVLRQPILSASADLGMGELGTAGTETAVRAWCCSGILLCRSPPGAEFSSFRSVLCLWSVFPVLSCKAYLSLRSMSLLKRGRNLVFLFIHCLCFTPANYPSGTKLNRTLNHLSLQRKGFEWINLPEIYPWGTFPYGEHLLCSFEWRQIQKITKVNVSHISVSICNIWRGWGRLI